MRMTPVILITVGKVGQSAVLGEIQAVKAGVNMNYVNLLLRSGGAPVVLPCLTDRDAIHAAVEAAHGVLLPGGGDILALGYGEEPHPRSLYQDPERDDMEF